MHEMSIVQSIIDVVENEANKSGARSVTEVELEIGRLSGIEYSSLEFALKVLAPSSIIEGAKIVLSKPPGIAVCNDCGKEFETNNPINECPDCSSYACSIIRGKELRVSSIVID